MKTRLSGILLCTLLIGTAMLTGCTAQSEPVGSIPDQPQTSAGSSQEKNQTDSVSEHQPTATKEQHSNSDYIISFYSKGEEVSLSDEQQESVYHLALESVQHTDTMLNQLLSDDEIQEARQNGIAVYVTVRQEPEKHITMIISDNGRLSSDGGSAHVLSGKTSQQLQQIAGWISESEVLPDAARSGNIEITIQAAGISAVDEKDIQTLYDIAKSIVSEDHTEMPLLITGAYEDAVIQQGIYLHVKNNENGDLIDLYLPENHACYGIYNQMKSYEISQKDQDKIRAVFENYKDYSAAPEHDPLEETGVQILYYGKLFLTDSSTYNRFRDIISDLIYNGDPVDLVFPAEFDELASQKGVFAKFKDENEEIYKVCLNTSFDGDTYYIILAKKQCWALGKSTITELEELLGITLS